MLVIGVQLVSIGAIAQAAKLALGARDRPAGASVPHRVRRPLAKDEAAGFGSFISHGEAEQAELLDHR
jgi:hypothetical protein